MADADEPEGWQVPFRVPALIAVATPVTLLVLLVASGWYYTERLRPATHQRVTSFPAPGLETAIHGGTRDPVTGAPPPHDDAAAHAAAAAVVHDGLPGWPAPR